MYLLFKLAGVCSVSKILIQFLYFQIEKTSQQQTSSIFLIVGYNAKVIRRFTLVTRLTINSPTDNFSKAKHI